MQTRDFLRDRVVIQRFFYNKLAEQQPVGR